MCCITKKSLVVGTVSRNNNHTPHDKMLYIELSNNISEVNLFHKQIDKKCGI